MITAKSYFSGAGGMDLGMIEAGINILESFEIDPKTNKEHKIYIEVKTTQNKTDTDFYISKNEIEQAKKFQKKYCLFRIYDLYGNTPKFYRRFGEIEENFIVDPISYIARIKN